GQRCGPRARPRERHCAAPCPPWAVRYETGRWWARRCAVHAARPCLGIAPLPTLRERGSAAMRWMNVTLALLALGPSAASADPIADFFKGKSINWILSAGAGGGYSGYAHVFAPYLSAHIPGKPNVIVQNMPGAGGIRAMIFLNNVA